MEEEKNDQVEETEDQDINLETEEDSEPETDWRAEAIKARGMAARLRTKLTKATEKKVEKEAPKTGELSDTDLNYLDLKGYSDDEELKIFQGVMAKTGMSARQVVKDEYALAKIATLRAQKSVEDATPSSTKRGGGQVDNLAAAIAKFERSGELPDDFDLRSQVIDAKLGESDNSKPAWHLKRK